MGILKPKEELKMGIQSSGLNVYMFVPFNSFDYSGGQVQLNPPWQFFLLSTNNLVHDGSLLEKDKGRHGIDGPILGDRLPFHCFRK